MPELLVCLAPMHVCLQTDAGYLPKSRKLRVFFFCQNFLHLQALLDTRYVDEFCSFGIDNCS